LNIFPPCFLLVPVKGREEVSTFLSPRYELRGKTSIKLIQNFGFHDWTLQYWASSNAAASTMQRHTSEGRKWELGRGIDIDAA